jgi:hypothetical protein
MFIIRILMHIFQILEYMSPWWTGSSPSSGCVMLENYFTLSIPDFIYKVGFILSTTL